MLCHQFNESISFNAITATTTTILDKEDNTLLQPIQSKPKFGMIATEKSFKFLTHKFKLTQAQKRNPEPKVCIENTVKLLNTTSLLI